MLSGHSQLPSVPLTWDPEFTPSTLPKDHRFYVLPSFLSGVALRRIGMTLFVYSFARRGGRGHFTPLPSSDAIGGLHHGKGLIDRNLVWGTSVAADVRRFGATHWLEAGVSYVGGI